MDPHRLSSSSYGRGGDREGLIHAYDEEENTGFGLTDLAEDSDEERPIHANGSKNSNPANIGSKRSFSEPIERPARSSPR